MVSLFIIDGSIELEDIHSQIHDFEVEHVVRPACVLWCILSLLM